MEEASVNLGFHIWVKLDGMKGAFRPVDNVEALEEICNDVGGCVFHKVLIKARIGLCEGNEFRVWSANPFFVICEPPDDDLLGGNCKLDAFRVGQSSSFSVGADENGREDPF